MSFLLRHGRIYNGRQHWTLTHRRWLAGRSFTHPAQQIAFRDALDAIEAAVARPGRLEQQLVASRTDRWRQFFLTCTLVENEEDIDLIERINRLDRHVFGVAGADADDQIFFMGRTRYGAFSR
jgi:hypothetical protein